MLIYIYLSINSSFAYLVGTVSIYLSLYFETRPENDLFPSILQNILLDKIYFLCIFKTDIFSSEATPKLIYIVYRCLYWKNVIYWLLFEIK